METRRCCIEHGTTLVETLVQFPGSPSQFPLWCLAFPGGHGVRTWRVEDVRGTLLSVAQHRPTRIRVADEIRRRRWSNRKPAANHPWRSA